jgi:hypothetical protein
MKRLLIIALLLLAGIPVGTAEEIQNQSIPAGPLLKKGGEFCAWQILYSYAGSPAPESSNPLLSAAPRKVTFMRCKTLWHAVTQDLAGNVLEQCFDGITEYIIGTKQQAPVFCPTDDTGGRTKTLFDFGSGNYPDMDWISVATFIKIQSLEGRDCLLFQKGDMMAWVDEHTRFPVLWRRGGETRVFQQLPAPTSIQFPPKVANFSEALRKDSEMLGRRARRGAAIGVPERN